MNSSQQYHMARQRTCSKWRSAEKDLNWSLNLETLSRHDVLGVACVSLMCISWLFTRVLTLGVHDEKNHVLSEIAEHRSSRLNLQHDFSLLIAHQDARYAHTAQTFDRHGVNQFRPHCMGSDCVATCWLLFFYKNLMFSISHCSSFTLSMCSEVACPSFDTYTVSFYLKTGRIALVVVVLILEVVYHQL